MDPATVGQGAADAGEQVGGGAVGDLREHALGRGGRVAGRGLELGQGAVDGVALVEPRHLAQRPQPDDEGDRLVDPEPQRTGDGVGVADEDPAALPVGLDELVGHLAVAAEEEQPQVGLELLGADPEVGRRPGRGRCPAG